MRIALINGSPRAKGCSAMLLEDLKRYLGDEAEILHFGLHSGRISEAAIKELEEADVWVFAYPLYLDSIPAHLLSCLIRIEESARKNPRIRIYAIVNCGFYEGSQAGFALGILRNWSGKAGFAWGGGLGIGGGGGLSMMPKLQSGRGPRAPIDKALKTLAESIRRRDEQENTYLSPAFPRFLYRIFAQIGWRRQIRKNGGKAEDLGKIPENVTIGNENVFL